MFTRHVFVGTTHEGNVFVTVRYKDERLSLTGVVGPKANGDSRGACGQILADLNELKLYGPKLTKEIVDKLKEVWKRWHLNDMRPGTPAQEEYLREKEVSRPKYNYDVACKVLTEAGLNPDNGYKYGTKWLFEKVPEEILEFLKALPETDLLPQVWRNGG